MESDSSDGATPYQTLVSSIKRPHGTDLGVKKRKKGVKICHKSKKIKHDVIMAPKGAISDEDISQSDSEDYTDPFYENLNYHLTENDIKIISTPSEPLLIPDHPLGHATMYPSPLPICPLSTDRQIYLKNKVMTRLSEYKLKHDTMTHNEPLSSTQCHLLSLFGRYTDVLYARETHERHIEVLEAIVAHLVSHVSKGRKLVIRNSKVSKLSDNEPPRDQGIVRPRVLILVPFRSSALRIIQLMGHLCGDVSHGRRLEEEFGCQGITDPTKPPEYRHLFEGNTDDCFKMGMALYSGTLRLFAPFYASDFIIASPLGLRTLVGSGGDYKREVDFLSSLEIVLLDQTEVFLMQNWSHVMSLLSSTHLKPRAMHGTDIRRVRNWALEELSKYYCQLIVCSQFLTPQIHSLFHSRATSRHHKIVITPLEYPGVLRHISHQTPQVFKRLPLCPLSDTFDERLTYFTDKILPDHVSGVRKRTLIFTPNYCDYLRVRNHLKEREIEFTHISEYSSTSQARRANSLFSQGQRDTLLLTERLMFFKCPRLPFASHLLLYGPPTFPHVYPQLLACVSRDKSATATCVYSREDALSLLRLLGPGHTDRLLNNKSNTHLVI
ncbi:hypothetical protein LOD99_1129 [Oopsacas minuta]|uniref:Digestive organ expansion factor n=1 Tax=Oopsacas minuta TaxID=111878 RepID=A0AAV7K776_9METZ|nr:hypothetical protein LOD99_1129 [Oopsacas minuta]